MPDWVTHLDVEDVSEVDKGRPSRWRNLDGLESSGPGGDPRGRDRGVRGERCPSSAPVPTQADADIAVSASPTTTVSKSLEATDSPRSASPAPTPRPTPEPTAVPVPSKPSGVKFDEQWRVSDDESEADITQTVTWQAPRGEGVEIKVYGVTECIARPANPAPDTMGPCLVVHTPLPASVRTLLAAVPASDGVASWTWTEEEGCSPGMAYDPRGPAYYAIVLAAYGASGHSIFAIAEPGVWWQPGPNDTVC